MDQSNADKAGVVNMIDTIKDQQLRMLALQNALAYCTHPDRGDDLIEFVAQDIYDFLIGKNPNDKVVDFSESDNVIQFPGPKH